VLVAAEEVRARLRRRLVEEYGVEEADMLLDPPGGWGELVTRDWLQLVLDARFGTIEQRFAFIEEKLASLDLRLTSLEGRFDSRLTSIDSRLTSIDAALHAQTWKLVAAMTGLLTVLVAAIKL
jgi:hypothetical protein